jgi:hypothetical protein
MPFAILNKTLVAPAFDQLKAYPQSENQRESQGMSPASVNRVVPLGYHDKPIEHGYGKCTQCSCPGFSGTSGYTCNRGGCGHHYDVHW